MSSEDWGERAERMEKQMAFILDQQAQAEIRWAKADERWAKADERWARTEGEIRALLTIAEIHEREIGELRAATSDTAKGLEALREAGLATDERLNALINVVERQISERRNGEQ